MKAFSRRSEKNEVKNVNKCVLMGLDEMRAKGLIPAPERNNGGMGHPGNYMGQMGRGGMNGPGGMQNGRNFSGLKPTLVRNATSMHYSALNGQIPNGLNNGQNGNLLANGQYHPKGNRLKNAMDHTGHLMDLEDHKLDVNANIMAHNAELNMEHDDLMQRARADDDDEYDFADRDSDGGDGDGMSEKDDMADNEDIFAIEMEAEAQAEQEAADNNDDDEDAEAEMAEEFENEDNDSDDFDDIDDDEDGGDDGGDMDAYV